jgi:hypothetical protein
MLLAEKILRRERPIRNHKHGIHTRTAGGSTAVVAMVGGGGGGRLCVAESRLEPVGSTPRKTKSKTSFGAKVCVHEMLYLNIESEKETCWTETNTTHIHTHSIRPLTMDQLFEQIQRLSASRAKSDEGVLKKLFREHEKTLSAAEMVRNSLAMLDASTHTSAYLWFLFVSTLPWTLRHLFSGTFARVLPLFRLPSSFLVVFCW